MQKCLGCFFNCALFFISVVLIVYTNDITQPEDKRNGYYYGIDNYYLHYLGFLR